MGNTRHHHLRRAAGCATRRHLAVHPAGRRGNEVAFNGTFLEIVPNAKIRNTFEYEPLPGIVFTETAEFEDAEGGTRVTVTSHFASKEDLNTLLSADAATDANESWDRLAGLFAAAS